VQYSCTVEELHEETAHERPSGATATLLTERCDCAIVRASRSPVRVSNMRTGPSPPAVMAKVPDFETAHPVTAWT